MATTLTGLTGRVTGSIRLTGVKQLDLAAATDPLVISLTRTITFGATDGKSDLIWHDERDLAATTAEELDLAGSLTNAFGDTLTFAKIDAIMFKNTSSLAATLEIGPPAANGLALPWKAADDKLLFEPGGGMWLLAAPAGWAVTAATGDLLEVENVDGVASVYEIAFVGRSA